MIDKAEEERWKDAWDKLNEKVDSGKMTLVQHQTMIKVWYELTKAVDDLRRPIFGKVDDAEADYHFTWAFLDVPETVATIYIKSNGHLEWFWIEAKDEDCIEGDSKMVADLIKALADKMKLFVKEENEND